MKFWTNWPYWVRGGVIGIIIALFFGLVGTADMLLCNYNPVDGSSIRGGVCRQAWVFGSYLPLGGAFWELFLLAPILPFVFLNDGGFFIWPPIILMIDLGLIGCFFGWLRGKYGWKTVAEVLAVLILLSAFITFARSVIILAVLFLFFGFLIFRKTKVRTEPHP